MKMLAMDDYNGAAKIYWWATAIAGLGCLAYALALLIQAPQELDPKLLAALVFIGLVGAFPVQIPGTKTSLAAAEIFIFLLLLLYGVPAAVVGAAIEVAIAHKAAKRRCCRQQSRVRQPFPPDGF